MELFLQIKNKNCNDYHDEYVTVLGQSLGWTQRFISSSIICPCGQSHPGTLPSQYISGLKHVLGQI